MQKYVEQLVQRIEEAKTQVVEPIDPKLLSSYDPETYFEGLENVEKYLSGEKTGAEETFGIARIEFPPSEKLNTDQTEILYKSLCDLLMSINNHVHLPDAMPSAMKYSLVVGLWEGGFMNFRNSNGMYGHDFCTGEPEGCAKGKYCPCLEYRSEKV